MGFVEDAIEGISVVADPANFLGIREGKGEKAQRELSEKLSAMQTPRLTTPTLKEFETVGNLEEIAKRLQLSDTELKAISTDPALREAQMKALSKLSELGETGLDETDRAALSDIAKQEAVQERGAREAIQQGAQRRGLGGSGLEFASLLGSQQGSAERQAQRDIDVAALSRQRAIDAIQRAGQLGGDIRRQEFGEQADVASAQDIINRFNTESQWQAAKEQALRVQNTATANTVLENERRIAENELPLRQFTLDRSTLSGNADPAIAAGQSADARKAKTLQTAGEIAALYFSGGTAAPAIAANKAAQANSLTAPANSASLDDKFRNTATTAVV